jgi:hypothetical protein
VNGAYSQILGRQADPTGLSIFVQALQHGATLEQVKAGLAGSPEFMSDAQVQDTTPGLTTPNQKFVDFLFQKVLSRPADASGLSTFTSALANGATATAVALAVLTSSEAYSDLVKSFYLQFLKRPADGQGLNAFTQALLSGATDEGVIVGIVASDEYFARV